MGQFWGLRDNVPSKGEDISKFITREFGRLYVQLDTFVNPMYWSLREEKFMEILGFPSLSIVAKCEEKKKEDFEDDLPMLNHKKILKNINKNLNKIGNKIGNIGNKISDNLGKRTIKEIILIMKNFIRINKKEV